MKFPENNLSAYYPEIQEWEYDLLRNSTLIVTDTVFHHSLQSIACIGMSDGSVNTKEGAYGWIFATNTGAELARGGGRIPTQRCSSYRAEAYGMLSLLRFLHHVSQNLKVFDLAAMQISTDSQSLVTKVTQYLQFDHYYPNTTLEPDWDVLQIICRTIRSLPFAIILIHVKGHQDRKPHQSLSIEAQLNIVADSIATSMLTTTPSKYSLFPGSGAI
jgi:ribonuclease HI